MPEYLFNVCPRCGEIDCLGPLAETSRLVRGSGFCHNYSGFRFIKTMCNECWEKHVQRITRYQHLQDDLDATFLELFDYPPFTYFRRGLITVEELDTHVREKIDHAIALAVVGDEAL